MSTATTTPKASKAELKAIAKQEAIEAIATLWSKAKRTKAIEDLDAWYKALTGLTHKEKNSIVDAHPEMQFYPAIGVLATEREALANFLSSAKKAEGAETKMLLAYWEMGKWACPLRDKIKASQGGWMKYVAFMGIPQARINRALRLFAKYPDPSKLEGLGLREALAAVAKKPANPMLEQIRKEWNRIMSRRMEEAARKAVVGEIKQEAKQQLINFLKLAEIPLDTALDTLLAMAYDAGKNN